ncbi:MAG TPA: response regulator transcription factor [Flavobacteriales bacterium]|jgi:DNA-binding NarL/FixJ family response regulator|nr:response regulator transcription factor [Flavobacteriales bacterium]
MSLHVILADDHAIVRRGLRDLFQHHFRGASLDEVNTCSGLIRALAAAPADLVVLDLELEDGNSMDILEQVRRDHPEVRILVYSMNPEHIYAPRILALGGAGFLSKQSSEDEAARAIARVLQGKRYVSEELEMKREAAREHKDPFEALSDREITVMKELLRGLTVKEIADRTGLQPTTVATYKARLFDKLGVSNLLDLQRLADVHKRL